MLPFLFVKKTLLYPRVLSSNSTLPPWQRTRIIPKSLLPQQPTAQMENFLDFPGKWRAGEETAESAIPHFSPAPAQKTNFYLHVKVELAAVGSDWLYLLNRAQLSNSHTGPFTCPGWTLEAAWYQPNPLTCESFEPVLQQNRWIWREGA